MLAVPGGSCCTRLLSGGWLLAAGLECCTPPEAVAMGYLFWGHYDAASSPRERGTMHNAHCTMHNARQHSSRPSFPMDKLADANWGARLHCSMLDGRWQQSVLNAGGRRGAMRVHETAADKETGQIRRARREWVR
ncbi:hypothetical protein P171DRAFT_443295 [Karstenula rhodostoma CBS 690.94]|uniref:Uncharacterized protein n=1 Tax=Karstenula rhodostoma CBS 690.94 TaxID=1392251 RepID=A0A9P4PK52_9PLEO|nr:hypothetical protein P171DRAFT_443295 [Karstenula rhodostoma CBS 690.94]